jgi:dienelactone hydrolase
VDRIRGIVKDEIQKFPDKNGKRIFVGGHSHGASLAIAFYLRSEIEIGGIVAAYGYNPLAPENIKLSSILSNIPVLIINNEFLKNGDDIYYTSKYIESLYENKKLFKYDTILQLG